MKKINLFSFCFGIALVFFFTFPTLGFLKTNYNFIYEDPYTASLTAPLLRPSESDAIVFSLPSLPNRSYIPLLEFRNNTSISAFIQKQPAHLVLLIPGLGANSTENTALFLGEKLYKQGYSVLILPSPFHWQFVLSQSTKALPAHPESDAKDLLRLMKLAVNHAQAELSLNVTKTSLVGYSMGALYAAYVYKMDKSNGNSLSISNAVLINPPINLEYSLNKLDEYYQIGKNWSQDYKNNIWGYLINLATDTDFSDLTSLITEIGIDKVLRLKKHQLQFIIGDNFKNTFRNSVFVSQQINDLGILKEKATDMNRQKRYDEIKSLTFKNYVDKFLFPIYGKKFQNSQHFIRQSDLRSLKKLLANDSAFKLMHNADDFLVRTQDIVEFSNVMGPRAIIYPKGGHVGNLWMQMNMTDLFNFLGPADINR
jgi:hypothetical protein